MKINNKRQHSKTVKSILKTDKKNKTTTKCKQKLNIIKITKN